MSSHRGGGGLGVFAALVLFNLAGCGGPKTYPVQGKVVLARGEVQQLAGGNIEFMLESDPSVRPYGDIKEDGTFSLKTIHKGRQLNGAPEGAYKARLLLSGDDTELRDRLSIDPRFFDFQASGLSFNVPRDGDVTVKLFPRGAVGTVAPPPGSSQQ